MVFFKRLNLRNSCGPPYLLSYFKYFSFILNQVKYYQKEIYVLLLMSFCSMVGFYFFCDILLMCCQILFACILLRIFASMFISDMGLQFSFFVTCLSGFGVRVMVASQNEFGSVPPSAILWKSLRRIGVSSSLNV